VIGLALTTVRAVNLRDHARNSGLRVEFQIAQGGRAGGAAMERLFAGLRGLPTVGVIAAGGIKYEYDGDVVDLMGLNNLHIAHNAGRRIGLKNHAAFEKKNLYELQPDIIVPLVVNPASWSYSVSAVHDSSENRALRGIYGDSEFTALYRYCLLTRRNGGPQPALAAWVHQRRLKELHGQPDLEIREFPDQRPSPDQVAELGDAAPRRIARPRPRYSSRSAVIGSMQAARRAGIAAASVAIATMPAAARPSVHGSPGSMP
jgi:hypothetical protein